MRSRLNAIVIALLMALTVVLSSPGTARAETVGLILTKGIHNYERIHDALIRHLVKEGVASKFKFLTQRPYPDPVAQSNAARKLIAADVDILLAYGTSEALALVREHPRVPVLYAGVYEPMVPKIKAKQVTGVCSKFNVSSLLRYLRSSTNVKTLGVMYCGHEEASVAQAKEIKAIANKYEMELKEYNIRNTSTLPAMMSSLQADALIITESPLIHSALPAVMIETASKKIPTASLLPDKEYASMITLTADPEEQGRLLGEMLIRVLNGESPNSIKPVCSRKVELVYNVKESKRMGLRMSLDLVTEATKLISK